jgi:quinol monooxygenase YgiN
MIVLTGTVRIPPENLADARPLMAAVVAATLKEDGCINYMFGEDVTEPGRIIIAEAWRDREALMSHLQQPHFAAWRMAGAELGVSDRNIMIYEAGDDPTPL